MAHMTPGHSLPRQKPYEPMHRTEITFACINSRALRLFDLCINEQTVVRIQLRTKIGKVVKKVWELTVMY